MFVLVLETASSIVWPAAEFVEREVPSLGVFRDGTPNCRDVKQRAGKERLRAWSPAGALERIAGFEGSLC
jgi:hypothetical protein